MTEAARKRLYDAEVLSRVGTLDAGSMVDLGVALAGEGIDHPLVWALIGARPGDAIGVKQSFESLLRYMRPERLDDEAVFIRYVSIVSSQIVAKRIAPREGAHAIWNASLKLRVDSNVRPGFVFAASEYDDDPVRYDAMIVASARGVLDGER